MVPLSSPASLQAQWILNPDKHLLQHPGHQKRHPLWRKLKLMVCPVSGILSQNTTFLETLPTSSWHRGDPAPKNSTRSTLNSGSSFVVKGKLIVISQVLNFLAGLYDKQLSYSTLNTTRSALSSILHMDTCRNFGSHPLTVRFMKGGFEKRPPHPRYNKIWDESLVLKYLASLDPVDTLTLKDLTLKLLMLLLLVTGQRGQSTHLLNIVTMHLSDTSCVFNLTSHTKTSQAGKPVSTITVQEFKQDCCICPVKALKEY